MSSGITAKFSKHSVCTNCGNPGHHFRNCTEPVTSYGILAFRTPSWAQPSAIATTDTISGTPLDAIELLLIQRRDSIGYVEILRAKYKLSEVDYIKKQIQGITPAEREKLLTNTFQDLWVSLWGSSSTESRQYKQEFDQAKAKFESLSEGYEVDGELVSFKTLFESIPVEWQTPEWGFPKGRRNVGESDYKCAVREFHEETGLDETQYRILQNVETIEEKFCGNNGIHYRHVYYIAWVPSSVTVTMSTQNELMNREVGSIGWFSLENANQKIRTTNPEKRIVLQKLSTLLRSIVPLCIGASAAQTSRKEDESTNRKLGNESVPWQQRLF
jgi:8-oxo-dGTP pyrophosphatase MutT (NUDIX family)